ncbi:strictosidine synthase [Ferrovibrio terrae]|uniref:Strictosidine synthase n=1 Tax=Ferrovibrio terrae TaxID=2594003 RepID=A0A516H1F7_9PROT|nr:strictosidine synthase [Ferrovibrio terrae]
MSFLFTRVLDSFLGRGESAITVPALDGALRPNRRLDDAAERIPVHAPGGIASGRDGLVVSSGSELHLLGGGSGKILHHAATEISCLVAVAGGIAFGCDDGSLAIIGGEFDGVAFLPQEGARCPTAMAGEGDILYVSHGSAQNPPSAWQRDLMERNASGSIWRLDLRSRKQQRIAAGLAYPAGLVVSGDGLIVAESWKHRIVLLDKTTGMLRRQIQGDLPGYPGHIGRGPHVGYVMTMFAPRNQLVEFILREDQYRCRMMAEVDPRYWVAPTYRSGRSYYEPLQGGGVKQLGILKPWAPTLSFGMVALLDQDCLPVDSFQSRADGATHGITGAVVHDGALYVASRGDDVVVRLDLGS